MMISTMSPKEHFGSDGTVATSRLSSAGRPSPLVTVGIMDDKGALLGHGERGEVVIRSSLVMAGYYKNPDATAEASAHGWHHTGDIGYLDEDNFLFIVDRAKDMIITGGFNVYSVEVEQALMAYPGDSGLRSDRVAGRQVGRTRCGSGATAPRADIDGAEVMAFVKARIGSVKTPKQVIVWDDLPRSKVGKVLKNEIKSELTG